MDEVQLFRAAVAANAKRLASIERKLDLLIDALIDPGEASELDMGSLENLIEPEVKMDSLEGLHRHGDTET